MTDERKYLVLNNGKILNGFDADKVYHEFAQLFKMEKEKATSLVGKKCVLKKGLDHKKALAYKSTNI